MGASIGNAKTAVAASATLSIRDVPVSCLPAGRLHPVSANFLQQYLEGRMSEALFRRYFSLPNSTYIPLSGCIVAWRRTLAS